MTIIFQFSMKGKKSIIILYANYCYYFIRNVIETKNNYNFS